MGRRRVLNPHLCVHVFIDSCNFEHGACNIRQLTVARITTTVNFPMSCLFSAHLPGGAALQRKRLRLEMMHDCTTATRHSGTAHSEWTVPSPQSALAQAHLVDSSSVEVWIL